MSGYSSGAAALMIAVALCGCATNQTPKPNSTPRPGSTAADVSMGSRLPGATGCASPCRTYTQDDIKRTGQTTVAGALGLLDPAVTITH